MRQCSVQTLKTPAFAFQGTVLSAGHLNRDRKVPGTYERMRQCSAQMLKTPVSLFKGRFKVPGISTA